MKALVHRHKDFEVQLATTDMWHTSIARKCRVLGVGPSDMPVVVVRLELKFGEVCFLFIFLAKPEVLLVILLQLLKIIRTDANILGAYRQLRQGFWLTCCIGIW